MSINGVEVKGGVRKLAEVIEPKQTKYKIVVERKV